MKENKKAFTLIEIIAVIIIIGIIALIAVPSVSKYIDDSRHTAYYSYEHSMEDAAKNRIIKCINGDEPSCEMPSANESDLVYLNELVDKGYLELMKNPDGEGFCDDELSYVEIANTGRDYEYTACLYCGQYKTDKALCTTYTMDNDDPVCGAATGEGTPGRWINTNRTISVKCSDSTTGCTRTSFSKTFTQTTKESTINIVDRSGRKTACPVNVYVDKTPPTCELDVVGTYDSDLGWYTGEVQVTLKNWQDTDSGVLTYGIGTSLVDKDYNKSTHYTVRSGITTVIGYVKDNAGNEGYCTKSIRVGAEKPKFDFRYGYQIYPNGETKTLSGITENGTKLTTTSTNPILTISNLNKYTNVDRVVITLNGTVSSSTIGSLTYSGSSNGTVTAPMSAGSNTITFIVPQGTYSQMAIKLGALSGKTYDISKIELYTTNGGIFTNKDVSIKIDPIDTGVRTTGYSYDGGSSFKTSDKNSFVRNTSSQLYTKNAGNILSDPVDFAITGIDKNDPTVTIKVTKTGTNTVVNNGDWVSSYLDFSLTAGNVGISGADIYYCIDVANTCDPNVKVNSGALVTAASSRTGIYYIRYKIVNSAGTVSSTSSFSAKVDTSTPTCTISLSNSNWTNQDITLIVTGQSHGSSSIVSYSWDGGTTFNGTRTKVVGANGTYVAKVKNSPGTIGTCQIVVTNIDKEPPVCTLKAEGVKYNGTGRFIGDVTISFASATDTGGSTVDRYGIGSLTGSKTVVHSNDNTATYTGYIKDVAGTERTCSITVEKNSAMTLTYNNNGGSGCSSKTINYNSQYGSLCTPTWAGHIFQGWYTAASGGTLVNSTTTVTTNANQTLYAHWDTCGAGTYAEAGALVCTQCPPGTMSGAGASSCTTCSAGTYNTGNGNTSCTTCPNGYFCTGGTAKEACPVGTKGTGTGKKNKTEGCSACDAGTYQPNTGQTSCTTCSAGTYNTGTGNTSCKTCENGYYCGGGAAHNACSAGYKGTGTGKKNVTEGCTICTAGTYSSSVASTTCTTCSAGTYNTGNGNTSCTTCQNGYYCTGGSNHTGCPAGTKGTGTGKKNESEGCTSCTSGTYSTGTGNTSCSTCPAGTYNTGNGKTSCITCENGFYCTGGTARDACPAGTKGTGTGKKNKTEGCTACPAGQYQANTGQTTCNLCGPGTYSSGTGNTSCTSCKAGTYNTGNGNSTCSTCPAGTYNTGTKNTSCTACEKGYYCTGGTNHTKCPVGRYNSSTNGKQLSDCSVCGPGTYQDLEGQTSCKDCPTGTYVPNGTTGQSKCTTCPAGTYNTGTKNTACAACGIGYYCPNSTTRNPCPSGSTTSTDKSTSRTECNFAATPSRWTKTTKTCGVASYNYYNTTEYTPNLATCTELQSFTCNASNYNKSYITCTPNYSYAFGPTSTSTVNSCTANTVVCGSSTYGQTNVTCTPNYQYGNAVVSTQTTGSCSATSAITCNAANKGKTYTVCTPNYSYSWGTASSVTASTCTGNAISCDASHYNQTWRSCTPNYRYQISESTVYNQPSCSATTSFTCDAAHYNKSYKTCSTNYNYSFGSASTTTASTCSANNISCTAAQYATGNRTYRSCTSNYNYSFSSSTTRVGRVQSVGTAFTCNEANLNKSYVSSVKQIDTYNWVADGSDTASSCSVTSPACNASNVGGIKITGCTTNYSYSWGGTSTSTVTSCSANYISCNANNYNKTYVGCANKYKYTFSSSTTTVRSCSTSSSFTCNASNKGKSYVATCVYNYSTKKYKKTTKTCNQSANGYTKTTKTCTRSVSSYTRSKNKCSVNLAGYDVTTKTCTRSFKNYTVTTKTCNQSVANYNIHTYGCGRTLLNYTATTKTCNRSVSNYTQQIYQCDARGISNYTKASKTCNRSIGSYNETLYMCNRSVASYGFTSSNATNQTSCSTGSSFTCNATNNGKSYVSGCTITAYTCPSGSTLKNTNRCYYNS